MKREIGRKGPGMWLIVAGLVMALVVGRALATSGSSSPTPPAAVGLNCEEHEVWADGDAAAVAARLPSKYKAFTDTNGRPLIFARAEHCDHLLAAGSSGPVTIADYGIVLQSPDGYGCSSGLPQVGVENGNNPPICNWYTLALVADDQRVVDMLGQGTPDTPVSYVSDLTYRMGAPDGSGTSKFHFASPSPSPSPFTIDDTDSFRPGTISLRGAYYFPDAQQGTVKMLVSTDDLTGGHADTTLTAAPGSELAAIMGATQRDSVEPYNEFGVIRVGHGVLRKQLLGPALPDEQLDTFAGSCSLNGDVTFDPPATNTQRPTVYAYDSKGTCTGTLDGKQLSGAPVTLRQSGHSDASCVQAMTTTPGAGTVTFADGTKLPYTLDFTSKLTELDGNAYGTRSGIATGHATFLTQRTPPDVSAQCAGDGLRTAPMDMTFHTNSPLVSESDTSTVASQELPARPVTTGRAGAARLRVTVRPARVRAGRRTRFWFRVMAGSRAANGAIVRFAGHRARVRHGAVTIMATLRHAGPYAVRVSRHGSAATATVVVSRR